MPKQVRVGGKDFLIPDGVYRIQDQDINLQTQKIIRTEYQFCLPSTHVVVTTWAADNPPWSLVNSDNAAFSEPEFKIIDEQDRRLCDFEVPKEQHTNDNYEAKLDWAGRELKEQKYKSSFFERDQLLDFSAIKYENLKTTTKEKESMSNLRTGTRVKVIHDFVKKYGTIVEVPPGTLESNKSLICMDDPHPDFIDFAQLVGLNHGSVHSHKGIVQVSSAEFSTRYDLYQGVPRHIGVCVNEPFKCDGVSFDVGHLGRVVEVIGQTMGVQFFNVPKLAGARKFIVPSEHLRWCRLDSENNKVLFIFHASTESLLGTDDILVYWSDKPQSISGSKFQHVITKGVLLKHKGYDKERKVIIAEIMSGMESEVLGSTVKVPKGAVRPFETPFINRGSEVEIVAEVTFKKKSLLGAVGTVVLATDFDGDIGIQFPEDIGAGSLDGAGQEGQCLYIPATSVRQISE